MASPKSTFVCTECGWSTPKWVGRCGECQAWDSMQEGAVGGGRGLGVAKQVRALKLVESSAAKPITDVSTERVAAWSTQVGEFDRVLGGGLVPGAVVLLSGEPGVGKSTLLLEVAANTAKSGKRVLYVTGEESVGQVRLRAERTGALTDNLYLAAETDLSTVLGQIDAVGPELLVVDSVQTIAASEIDGAAGMPSQIREVAANLIRVAKERALPVILVGHVTKDGSIAGPRALEHLVDVVVALALRQRVDGQDPDAARDGLDAACLGLGADHVVNLMLGADIHPAHRVIHQHDRGPGGQSAGEQHFLLVPPRKGQDRFV